VTSALTIHASCAALLLANLAVRTWRTQVIFRGLGRPVPFVDVMTANLAGDAAAALTPLRVGGLPAQIAFFQRRGVAPQVTVPTLLVESILLYPVYAVIGAVLATVAGRAWFAELRTFGSDAGRALAWLGVIFAVGWLLVLLLRRAAPHRSQQVGQSLAGGLALVRNMGPRPALLTVPLTVADVLTRIALLPILALGLVNAPPADVLAIASFAMLYGQIAMPTPGGAGIVDLGVLGGAAGDLGTQAGTILLWWRAYTAGIHIVLSVPCLWWRLARRPTLADAR
jgi:uncharacterized membrane protein YbhN (UPF0104 family)